MSDTKSKIITAAIDLFADNGYTETSMRSIAISVGIKSSSIYHHFQSKSEILFTIFREYMDYMSNRKLTAGQIEDLDAKTVLHNMFFTFDETVQVRMTKILKIILHEQFREEHAHEFVKQGLFRYNYNYLKDIMDQLVQLKKIRPIDTDAYAKLFVSLLITASIEVMHAAPDEARYFAWERENNVMDFLIDQIVDG